jgi:hypothetical protein
MIAPQPGRHAAPSTRTRTPPLVPPARGLPGRHLIAGMLLAVATVDLARCGVVMVSARHAGPAVALVVADVAAAALTLRAAYACEHRRRWPAWVALIIGLASGPQAAASGFEFPYAIPDTATAALGVLLTVAVLTTAGHTRPTAPLPGAPGPTPFCADGQPHPLIRGPELADHPRPADHPGPHAHPSQATAPSQGTTPPQATSHRAYDPRRIADSNPLSITSRIST